MGRIQSSFVDINLIQDVFINEAVTNVSGHNLYLLFGTCDISVLMISTTFNCKIKPSLMGTEKVSSD